MVRRISLLLLAIVCAGAAYQAFGTWRDGRRFAQRGRSYAVADFRMNLNCSGSGGPTVVLDSGMGGTVLDWVLVQPEVAKFTRVCSYDRPGYGWSDASPQPRTSLNIASELHALLHAAGERSPFVLAGHSFGGYNIRVYAGLYPKEVAGMVLVDASHPDQERRVRELLPAELQAREKQNDQRSQLWDRIVTPVTTYLGIRRLALALHWDISARYSRALQEEVQYVEQQPKYERAVEEEDRLFAASGQQAKSAGTFGSMPLLVLTAGKQDDPDPLLTDPQRQRQANVWIHELQAEQTRLSTRGRQIVVPDSTHDMPTDRPDAIVALFGKCAPPFQQNELRSRLCPNSYH